MQAAKIFVRRLPFTVGNRELQEYFNQFGRVKHCNIFLDKKTGILQSYGWVTFHNEKTLQKVMEKDDHFLEGYKVEVMKYTGSKKEENSHFQDD